MRTTVTLDPDVVVLLEAEVRQSGLTFEQVLNDAVREGMRARRSRASSSWASNGQRTFRMGKVRLSRPGTAMPADTLEDDAIMEKLRRGR